MTSEQLVIVCVCECMFQNKDFECTLVSVNYKHLLTLNFMLTMHILVFQETAREHYCNIFTHSSALFVFNYMEDDMYNRGLTGLAKCVNFYDSDEIFTPDELITSLRAWYNKMVSDMFKLKDKPFLTLFYYIL